ncbi:MAG: YhbY family RNA-binding protein [Spirochaetota bacterium]|nr:YhbY family RNA-binding protein [Spirochaetota bacterium]
MKKISSRERNKLRKEAHTLKPVINIGKNGVTPELIAAVDAALTDHELIKIKFQDFKEDRRALTTALSDSVKATVISVIGNIAILYRELDKQ